MKTFFCSDTHFNHPNILKYEPTRVEAIAEYICGHQLEYEFLRKIDAIGGDENYPTPDEQEYNASVVYQNQDSYDYIFTFCREILDVNHATTDEEEQDMEYIKAGKELQDKMIEILLYYQTEMMIERWNEVVGKDDLVYFLGDFGFKNKQGLEEIGRRLNGHKVIILGNHDERHHNEDGSIKYNATVERHFKAAGFERVEFNPIILKGCFILSHEPLYYMNESMPYYNIYGHVHSNPIYKTKTENSCCVCLDRWDYYPIEIEEYNNYDIIESENFIR